MTNKAAFQARFAHYERKPGLKVMRLHFEVPLEKGMETISILGEPTPDNDVWVGIALLGGEREEEKSSGRKWHELKPSQQAGIRCSDASFQRFLKEQYNMTLREHGGDVAATVRKLCLVESRSELDNDTSKNSIWSQLNSQFQAWMAAG